jgi:cytochrome c biogenesis protein
MAEQGKIRQLTRRGILLDFLGSMNLAITILVIIAVASVIGTVLQQNQPYNNYIIKFGPFWHEFFKTLNLYDIYSASWFLVLLLFLVISTSVCIYRNVPVMLNDMRNYRLNAQLKTLRTMENSQDWQLSSDVQATENKIKQFLQVNRYQLREKQHADRKVITGMRGKWNRLGYMFAHVGIIVLCIGGFMDGTFDIALREWTGKSVVDINTELVKDMPEESQLKPGELFSFRGNISIPEGLKANFVLLQVREGRLVQYLPFAVELKDFRVEHYESGQPKSFESDLVIHDDQLDKPLEKTISVNYPLIYRGYHIYQASFGDGGSKLKFKVWPFNDYQLRTLDIDGVVQEERIIDTAKGQLTLEFVDFKKFNVFPAPKDDPQKRKFMNFGSSVVFKVRDSSGAAREYINFMSPVLQNERYVFITGMRTSVAEDYRYLHIPSDDNVSIDRFMKFHALLNNTPYVQKVAVETVNTILKDAPGGDQFRDNIIRVMMDLLDQFNYGGYQAIERYIRDAQVDNEQKRKMAEAYSKVLDTLMKSLYVEVLRQEGVDVEKGINRAQEQFYFDALDALRQLHLYGTPFYLQLTDFTHRESSGLSIAKLPGKNIFYLGCLMVIIGIFLLFYVTHQRVWLVMYTGENGASHLLFAGSGNRNQSDFRQHFQELSEKVNAILKA